MKGKTVSPQELAAVIRQSRRAVAFTGAGISVESGIPDFRSEGGLWSRFDPREYAHISAFRKNPAKVWQLIRELDETLSRARPNPAHHALAALEAKGLLIGVITQNVDNLHQAAGSRRVVEYHGNAFRFVCLECRRPFPREELDFARAPLFCPCGGLIKPDVVFFGEQIPPGPQEEAEELAQECDLFLVIGTSGEVAPASYLPYIARDWGAAVAEVNLEPTRLTHRVSDYFLPGPAGVMLPLVIKEM